MSSGEGKLATRLAGFRKENNGCGRIRQLANCRTQFYSGDAWLQKRLKIGRVGEYFAMKYLLTS